MYNIKMLLFFFIHFVLFILWFQIRFWLFFFFFFVFFFFFINMICWLCKRITEKWSSRLDSTGKWIYSHKLLYSFGYRQAHRRWSSILSFAQQTRGNRKALDDRRSGHYRLRQNPLSTKTNSCSSFVTGR